MELNTKLTSSWVTSQLPAELAPGRADRILLFGPDQGGIFEFALLATASGRERFDAKTVDAQDAIAALASGSLFGPASSVIIDGATDAQAPKIAQILEAGFAEGARLVVTAGDLKKTSKLRKLFAGQDTIAAPLYTMRDQEIARFATTYFRAAGLEVDRDALQALGSRMSGDRALSARACEVVELHTKGRGAARVSLLDVRAMLDSIDEDGLTAPFDAALLGNPGPAVVGLQVRLAAGENFVPLLRAFSYRAFRLRDMLASGLAPAQAVAKAKPPVFWAEKAEVTRILSGMTLAKMDLILAEIDRTEYRIIEEGVPAPIALATLIVDIAHHRGWKEAA